MHSVSLTVSHPIERVWRAVTTTSELEGWQAERVTGEVTPGGTVTFAYDSLGLAIELEVVALEPPHRLSLRGGPARRAPQTQTITLTERGATTEITLHHDGFEAGPRGDQERAGTIAGWYTQLRLLRHYLDHKSGARRIHGAALTTSLGSLDAAWGALSSVGGLSRWLGQLEGAEAARGPVLGEGEPFAMRTHAGSELSGLVLATAAPYQLALSLPALDAVLVLRAVAIDGDPAGPLLIGAQAYSYAPTARFVDLLDELPGAVAKLPALLGPPGPPGGATA